MTHFTRARAVLALLAILVGLGASWAGQTARYFRAECGTSAGYIKLGPDGKYVVIWREHMGVILTEKGQWNQNGSAIAFSPTGQGRGPYQGTVNTHEGRTFLLGHLITPPGSQFQLRQPNTNLIKTPKRCRSTCSSRLLSRCIEQNEEDISVSLSLDPALIFPLSTCS